MDRKLGGLLLALLVVLIGLWVTTLAYGGGWELLCGPDRGPCEMGGCTPCHPTWPRSLAGVAIWVGGAVVLLGGFWCAWRLGSGRWALRRRPTPGSPAAPFDSGPGA